MKNNDHAHRVVDRVAFGLIVTSDKVFRGEKEDKITPMVSELIEQKGYHLVYKAITPNVFEEILEETRKALENSDVVLVTGGTGLSSKDLVVRVVDYFNGIEIPGFGELFRMLSWNEVGARAWISRAKAKAVDNKVLFALPGSPSAVKLALEKLILPVIAHILWELRH